MIKTIQAPFYLIKAVQKVLAEEFSGYKWVKVAVILIIRFRLFEKYHETNLLPDMWQV